MRYKLVALFALAALVGTVSAFGYVYAQTNSTGGTTTAPKLTDQQTELVIIATIVGGLAAPIIQWAGSEANKTTGTRDKFDWGQYALAVIIVLPATFGIIMTELQTLTFSGVNLQANAIVFILAFLQGMGVNTIKKNIQQSLTNKTIQIQKS